MESGLGRGRPSAVLVPAAARGAVAGIDFGHSHVSVAVAQSSGRVLAEHRRTIDVDHQATGALDTAAALLARCLADAHLVASDLISVAAGIPGPLDMKTGLVRSPTILSTWVDLDPARELSTRLGRPIQVGNDANMGAHGELRFGAARGCRDFVYVKASHGIGAGLVLNGDTYRGTLGIAGEIGHTQLPGADNWCRCGNRGCLEAVVSISEVKGQLTHIRAQARSGRVRPVANGNQQRSCGRAGHHRSRPHPRPRTGRPLQRAQPRSHHPGRRTRNRGRSTGARGPRVNRPLRPTGRGAACQRSMRPARSSI